MATRTELAQAIAVTAELVGAEISEAAMRVMVDDLMRYPQDWVLASLTRCRRELKTRALTLSDILTRLDDGRPGPEEAWAMLPKDEATTAVWTEEMQSAYAVAAPLIEDDRIAARVAFKEAYTQAVQKARDIARPVQWSATLGHDPHAREPVLIEAAQRGRLSGEYVAGLLPYRNDPSAQVLALTNMNLKRLTA